MHVTVYTSFGRASAGRFPQDLAYAIASTGPTVTLVAPRAEPTKFERSHERLSRLLLFDVEAKDGRFSRVLHIIRRTFRSLSMLTEARRRSPYFIVTFLGQTPAGLLSIAWLRLLGATIIYVVHDPNPHAWSFPVGLQRVERAMLWLSYHLPYHLVTLSEAGRQELIESYGCSSDRVEVIAHGALLPSSGTTPLSGEGRILLFGMLRRNKRIHLAIEAFKRYQERFPQLRLHIAGAPHREDPGYWQTCAAEMSGAGDRVTCEIGFLEEHRLDELIESSDGILLAYEDFKSQSGAAVLSCFSERVVVGTTVGGLGELNAMGLEIVQIAVPVTTEAIADALELFASLSCEELRIIAARSRKKLESKLAWDGIGRQYVDLLSRLSAFNSRR